MASNNARDRKHYTAVKRSQGGWTNPGDRPVGLGDNTREARGAKGGWAQFVLPLSNEIVALKIPDDGDPHAAVREWAIRNIAQRRKRAVPLDLEELAILWNYGSGPEMKREGCGFVHLHGTRTVEWGEYVGRAIEIWASHGQRGLYPQKVLTCLEPDARLPFLPSLGATTLPPHKRCLFVAIDIGRPLDDQLKAIEQSCRQIRKYSLELAHLKARRPGGRESPRDVLVYTLRHSALLTVSRIAKEIFPRHDRESSERLVKGILQKVEAAVSRYGFRPPKIRRSRRDRLRTD